MKGPHSTYVQQLTLVFLIGSIVFYLYVRLTSSLIGSPNDVKNPTVVTPTGPKRVLVTGGAGFIGFHLSKALAENKENHVVVVDNFNDYYDVKLKIDRAYELHQLGIEVLDDDVCNEELLHELLTSQKITHVAHLAAQAGVRYSLQNPLAYVRANIECQVALLDVLRSYKDVKLVYASSSSVYGKESEIPFSLRAHTDRPGNMYAASKKTDELLGYHYCHAYNISSVGLRFFTVYGPWGRPDMAVFKFAQSLLDGKEVPLYEDSSDPLELGRDFTYIDDIVHGIMASLDYEPAECGERFNLGFGNPVSVPEMVEILQKELNVQGKIKKLPLPPTEILRTWADLSTSNQLLGFKPQTPLHLGIKKFVVWYKGYRKWRQDQDENDLPSHGAVWFQKLQEQRRQRAKQSELHAVERHNQQLKQRIQHHQQKYLQWAQENGIETREFEKSQYSFFQGQDSSGNDIVRLSELRNNIEGLKAKCSEMKACFAFNSEGVLKSSVHDQKKWDSVPFFKEPHQGLYVAEINMCRAGLHDCAKYAKCTPILPAQFSCKCLPGYFGNGKLCIPRYGEVEPKELQWEYAADLLSLHNVSQMKQGKQMVFFQGLDSPGGDYMVADKFRGNAAKLKEICSKDPICIGVNTNGLMKRRIADKSAWTPWTSDPKHGIYVYDVDYCSLAAEDCPKHAKCKRLSPGHFTCVCHAPYSLIDNECLEDTSSPNDEVEKQKNVIAEEKTHAEQDSTPKPDKPRAADTKESRREEMKQEQIQSSDNKALHFNVGLDGLTATEEESSNPNAIEIIVSTDGNDLPGVPTLLNSITAHTTLPVHINIVTCNMDINALVSLLKCYSFSNAFKVSIVPFDPKFLNDGYHAYMKRPDQGNFSYLSNCANYARFFFYRLLPSVPFALYLDADIVVQHDIVALWKKATQSKKIITAVERDVQYSRIFAQKTKAVFKQRYSKELDMKQTAFNAGVFAVNLKQWRKKADDIENDLQFWMKQNVEKHLWDMGTQPLMLIVFYADVQLLASHWHLEGLGWKEQINEQLLNNATVLHWNGPKKPWQPHNPLYYELWNKHSPIECQGHGKCLIDDESQNWLCVNS